MPGEFQIVTGEHDWKVNSTHESWHNIKNIVVHSKYDGHAPRYDYDYAIIEVIEPIKLTGHSKARAACLPDQTKDINFPHGTEFVVSGWGRLKYKGWTPAKLHHVTVHAISDAKCKTKQKYKTYFSERMHCAGNLQNGGFGTCNGDSGGKVQRIQLYYQRIIFLFTYFLLQIIGPITWIDPGTKRAKLIGVVSWGVGCAGYGHPNVYAEVAKVMDWVNYYTGYCGTVDPEED